MRDFIHTNIADLKGTVKDTHASYKFSKATIIPRGEGKCSVSVYEIEPGKSNYPYHWHTENEEVFYIIAGEGTLRTPQGDRTVKAGDILYFPPHPCGAHKLTNTGSETLRYIDFDTENEIAVTFYPDSNKMGVWGLNVNKVYPVDSNVDYYDGE